MNKSQILLSQLMDLIKERHGVDYKNTITYEIIYNDLEPRHIKVVKALDSLEEKQGRSHEINTIRAFIEELL